MALQGEEQSQLQGRLYGKYNGNEGESMSGMDGEVV